MTTTGKGYELLGFQDQAHALNISFHFITVQGYAAGQELNQVSFMLRVTDVKGTSFLQKSEETFQTDHTALLVTNLHLY